MKVCILSDSHDNIPLLRTAVAAAKSQGAQAVLHCGDTVAPSTIAELRVYGLPVHLIHGNNPGDVYALAKLGHQAGSLFHYYGQDADFTLAKRRIFLVHYPHYARAMAATGDYDLVCCGHTHHSQIERVKNIHGSETFLVNPGTVGGVGADPTYILADLDTMEFTLQTVALPA